MTWIIAPHIESGSGDAKRYALALKERGFTLPVVKLVNAAGLAAEYRSLARLIIARVTIVDPSLSSVIHLNPVTEAQKFVDFLAPHIIANPSVDAWEVWNEPTINTPEEMTWLAAYLAECVRLIKARYNRLCVIANFSTGNPSHKFWAQFVPALRAIMRYGGYVGVHEYANRPARDGNGNLNVVPMVGHVHADGHIDSLLGRQKDTNKHWANLGFANVPVVITECGLDGTESGAAPYKQSGYTPHEYAHLMGYYSDWMGRNCPNVIGATIFTSGHLSETWANHDIEGTGVMDKITEEAVARISPSVPPPLPAENLIINGGFESAPDGVGWQLYIKRTNAENKNPTFRIERAEKGASPLSRREGNAGGQILGTHICYVAGVRQSLILSAGRYSLSAVGRTWMRGDARFDLENDNGTDCSWLIRVRDAAGILLESGTKLSGWQSLSGEFTAQGGQVVIEIECDMGGEQNHWPVGISAFSFDDVKLTRLGVTPPPPTPIEEKPLFSFHGANQVYRFYSAPALDKPVAPRVVSHVIDVFEIRPYGGPAGVWARVTRRDSKVTLWMRMGV